MNISKFFGFGFLLFFILCLVINTNIFSMEEGDGEQDSEMQNQEDNSLEVEIDQTQTKKLPEDDADLKKLDFTRYYNQEHRTITLSNQTLTSQKIEILLPNLKKFIANHKVKELYVENCGLTEIPVGLIILLSDSEYLVYLSLKKNDFFKEKDFDGDEENTTTKAFALKEKFTSLAKFSVKIYDRIEPVLKEAIERKRILKKLEIDDLLPTFYMLNNNTPLIKKILPYLVGGLAGAIPTIIPYIVKLALASSQGSSSEEFCLCSNFTSF